MRRCAPERCCRYYPVRAAVRAGAVFTGAYPALATDAAPLLAAVLLCAEGPGSIEDVIFERRFGCAAGFAALGGRVRVEGRTLYAEPGGTLQGTVLEAPDLRGGAALVIAALAAQGRSRITHTEFIDRGYADFCTETDGSGWANCTRNPARGRLPEKKNFKNVNLTCIHGKKMIRYSYISVG